MQKGPITPTPPKPDIPRRLSEMAGGSGRRSGEPASGERDTSRRLSVGRDITLTGEITACNQLVVDGRVEARLTECHTIEISETGVFKGSAEIDGADIGGRFEGDLTVRGRLRVRATGLISGSVRYGELEVEAGGRIVGTIDITDQVVTPMRETAPAKPREVTSVHKPTPEPEPADDPPKSDVDPMSMPEPAPAARAAEWTG